MTKHNKLPDEADVLDAIDRLGLEAKLLQAEMKRRTGETIAAPTMSNGDDILGDQEKLEAHVAALKAKLDLPPKSTLRKENTPAAAKRKTLTEQCREAKAHGSRNQAKYTGITARCIAAKTQTTEDTEHHTH